MDIDKFNKEATELYEKSLSVPGLRSSWKDGFLTLYALDKSLEEWKLVVCYSFAYNSPDLYFRKSFTGLSIEQLEYLSRKIEAEVTAQELHTGEMLYKIHTCRSQSLATMNLSAWLSAFVSHLELSLPASIFIN